MVMKNSDPVALRRIPQLRRLAVAGNEQAVLRVEVPGEAKVAK
jgi:hypothetical protein